MAAFEAGCDIIATICEYLATDETNPETPARLSPETLQLLEMVGNQLVGKIEAMGCLNQNQVLPKQQLITCNW